MVSAYAFLDYTGRLGFCSKNELLTSRMQSLNYDRTTITEYTYDVNGYVLTSDNGYMKCVFEYE